MLRSERIRVSGPRQGARGGQWMVTEVAFSRIRAAVRIPGGYEIRAGGRGSQSMAPRLLALLIRACRKNGPKSKR